MRLLKSLVLLASTVAAFQAPHKQSALSSVRPVQKASLVPMNSIKITVRPSESVDSVIMRLRREVNKSGHLRTLRNKRYHEDAREKKKRKLAESRRKMKFARQRKRRAARRRRPRGRARSRRSPGRAPRRSSRAPRRLAAPRAPRATDGPNPSGARRPPPRRRPRAPPRRPTASTGARLTSTRRETSERVVAGDLWSA